MTYISHDPEVLFSVAHRARQAVTEAMSTAWSVSIVGVVLNKQDAEPFPVESALEVFASAFDVFVEPALELIEAAFVTGVGEIPEEDVDLAQALKLGVLAAYKDFYLERAKVILEEANRERDWTLRRANWPNN